MRISPAGPTLVPMEHASDEADSTYSELDASSKDAIYCDMCDKPEAMEGESNYRIDIAGLDTSTETQEPPSGTQEAPGERRPSRGWLVIYPANEYD